MTFPSDPDAQVLGLFWLLRLDGPLPAAVEPEQPATFLQASLEDSAELAVAMGLDDIEPVLQRFARGCQCHITRINGQLVGYGWITFAEERIGSLGLRVRLQPGEAYIWDCATLAAYRGQRLYPALLSSMLRALHAAGYWRIWIGMDADNLASQAGVARAGFRLIAGLQQAQHASTHPFQILGSPDASEQEVRDASTVLLGERQRP
ncbi:MAG TPA: GNAT family N-acetyltransferase [Ktedonobacteraceae bacterium]